jgi:hypothetical protein
MLFEPPKLDHVQKKTEAQFNIYPKFYSKKETAERIRVRGDQKKHVSPPTKEEIFLAAQRGFFLPADGGKPYNLMTMLNDKNKQDLEYLEKKFKSKPRTSK